MNKKHGGTSKVDSEPKRLKRQATNGETIRNILYYQKVLAKSLPKEIFRPNSRRLIGTALLCLGWMLAIATIAMVPLIWPLKLALGLFIGYCYGISGLMAHELLHGSIVRNTKAMDVLGWILLMPFAISPTFWKYWHNRLHHGYTQKLIMDPDAYPTYRLFLHSRYMKWMYPFTPGSGYWRSYLYFFFWFSFNVFVAQTYFRFRNGIFKDLNHRRVNWELTSMVVALLGIWTFTGWQNFLWVAVIPFAIQNYLVFSYISTNHNLSPMTKHNDPLQNSLTVTNPPVLEFFHLNFGYHVEHHIFPTMSPAYAKQVHKVLKSEFTEDYKVMPKWLAIKKLYATARIYKNSTTLIHPYTKETYKTLGH